MTGKFIYLPLATLQTMLAEWQACLTSIATAHQSYSIGGRSFTRANLAEVSDMVAELSYAVELNGGTVHRVIYADMSGS